MNNKRTELKVSALRNGTVIDHIPTENTFRVFQILNLEHIPDQVYFGTNLESKKFGKKGIIKISGKFFAPEEINKIANRLVMLVRPSYRNEKKLFSGIKDGTLIYSLWGGYLEKPYTKKFIDFLEKYGYTLHYIHTGGHADVQTLQELVETVNPKRLVPMHTFSPEVFEDLFNTEVLLAKDGVVSEV